MEGPASSYHDQNEVAETRGGDILFDYILLKKIS